MPQSGSEKAENRLRTTMLRQEEDEHLILLLSKLLFRSVNSARNIIPDHSGLWLLRWLVESFLRPLQLAGRQQSFPSRTRTLRLRRLLIRCEFMRSDECNMNLK